METRKNPLLIGAIVVLLLVVAGGVVFALTRPDSSSNSKGATQTPAASSSKSPSSSTDASTTPASADAVTIKDFAYSPKTLTVKVGTKVTWTNQDSVRHTVTVDSGDGPASELFGQGETFTYTFSKTGTYTYHCDPHPYMHGSVVVTD